MESLETLIRSGGELELHEGPLGPVRLLRNVIVGQTNFHPTTLKTVEVFRIGVDRQVKLANSGMLGGVEEDEAVAFFILPLDRSREDALKLTGVFLAVLPAIPPAVAAVVAGLATIERTVQLENAVAVERLLLIALLTRFGDIAGLIFSCVTAFRNELAVEGDFIAFLNLLVELRPGDEDVALQIRWATIGVGDDETVPLGVVEPLNLSHRVECQFRRQLKHLQI